ncbi:MAG: hypothetical protein ACIAXF_12890 [Phycisphaerales bacterium JB063]
MLKTPAFALVVLIVACLIAPGALGQDHSASFTAALEAYEHAVGNVRDRYRRDHDRAQARFSRTVQREHGRYLRALDRLADKLEKDDEDAAAAAIRVQHRAASGWDLSAPEADGACFLDTILVDVEGSPEASQLGVDFLVVATEAKLACVEDIAPLEEAYRTEMWDAMQSQRARMERFGHDRHGHPHEELLRFRRKLFEMGDITAGDEAFSGQVLLLTGSLAPPGVGQGRPMRLKYYFNAREANYIEAFWSDDYHAMGGDDLEFEWEAMDQGRGVVMRYRHGRGGDIKPCVAEWRCAEDALWPMRVSLWWDVEDYDRGVGPDEVGVAQRVGSPIEDVTKIASNRGSPSFYLLMQETVGPGGEHSGQVLWYTFNFDQRLVTQNASRRYPQIHSTQTRHLGPMVAEQDGFILTLRRDPRGSPERREFFRIDYTNLHHPVVEYWHTIEAYEAGDSPHAVNLGDIKYVHLLRGDGPEQIRRMTEED